MKSEYMTIETYTHDTRLHGCLVVDYDKWDHGHVFENPYDPEHPYMFQFTPLFAEYPFGQEYIVASYPSSDSTTRVYYHEK